jgi:hypothetical protein
VKTAEEAAMPIASQRPQDKPDDKKPVDKSQGGARTSTNETPVSSAENPDPRNDTSNTPGARPKHAGHHKVSGPTASEASEPGDIHDANGRDHPAESEHDHTRNKLHGVSEERTDVRPEGWVPAKGKVAPRPDKD